MKRCAPRDAIYSRDNYWNIDEINSTRSTVQAGWVLSLKSCKKINFSNLLIKLAEIFEEDPKLSGVLIEKKILEKGIERNIKKGNFNEL